MIFPRYGHIHRQGSDSVLGKQNSDQAAGPQKNLSQSPSQGREHVSSLDRNAGSEVQIREIQDDETPG